jgi:leucyl aminopeptidase
MNPRILIGKGVLERQKADFVALPIALGTLETDPQFDRLNRAVDGELRVLAQQAEFTGRADQVFECTTLGRLPQQRILLVGTGADEAREESRMRNFAAVAVRHGGNSGAARLALELPANLVAEQLRAIAEGIMLGAYRFTKYLTSERRPKRQIEAVILCGLLKETASAKRAIESGQKIGQAVSLCRDAVNEPSNVMTPVRFAQSASEIARRHGFRTKILDARGIDRAGMSLLSAVGRGSRNEPRFVHLTYVPKSRPKKKIVLLGKGLTFDSGGLCIKPAAGMDEMKSDMAGAAAVLGVMDAVGALTPAVEVHGLFVLAENMPDGNAYRPGDVFGSLDGKTVEIINTDAEGRLALADGLAYARKLRPDLIVDAATLTGASMVALGKSCSAYFTADEDWSNRFKLAAQMAGESFWRMPLLAEMRDQLKSDVADLKHTGDRFGGSISAAMFLKEFVGEVPWIHCDVAGPVLADRPRNMYPKGATGHPVLTFIRFIEALG